MKQEINYNFALSKGVANRLEEIAAELDNAVLKQSDADILLLAQVWQSNSSDTLIAKYERLIGNLEKIRDDIISESEQINIISRRMLLIEQEAKRIAQTRED